MTDFMIAGTIDDAAELRALYSAIIDNDDLRPLRKSLVAGTPSAEQMGAEDIVRIALDGTAATAMATCVAAWINSRRSKLRLRVKGKKREVEIIVDGRGAVTKEAVKRALDIAEGTVDGASE